MTEPEQSYQPVASPGPTALEPDWSGAAAVPALPLNQIVAQLGANTNITAEPDGVYLTLGHAGPPVLLGTAEQVERQLEEMQGRVAVEVHGRYFLTRDRLGELIAVLQNAAQQFDSAVSTARGSESE